MGRFGTTVIVGMLTATPARAGTLARVSVELDVTLGGPLGIGVSSDVFQSVSSLGDRAVLGGAVRFDAFFGGGSQLVVEPLVGLSVSDVLHRSCAFNTLLMADVRPGFALRSRGGPALTLASAVDFGATLHLRGRLGGAFPLTAEPLRPPRMSLGALQDLTLSLGGGPGVMVAGKPTGCGIPGRPLREDGRLSLTEADGPRDAGLAEDWLEQARGEHAAVASFLRLSLELEALGAPLDLVERCRHAAAQEAIHAGLCAQRAADHSGATVVLGELITAPRAFETRGEGLRVVGVESWVDGFVNEGWAAVVAWRKALQVSDARDRQIHLRIAHEELQHARLGGDLASWCMAELQKPARAPHGQASKSSLLSGA